jgi:subtilisin family serine protease
LALMDAGISNDLQDYLGKQTVDEYDYINNDPKTDEGNLDNHGDYVLLSALDVSVAYDVYDLRIADPMAEKVVDILAVERALADVLATDDALPGDVFSLAAINMSFSSDPSAYAAEISELAANGILCVVASGNKGNHAALEDPDYPAALPDVICVGSHDGSGRPSEFSRNGPGVDILADGEDMPFSDSDGTSFAAPRVAATVTHVQAIVNGLTGGGLLDATLMVDALQQGGAGPRSLVDLADGVTRYFLHDHAGTLDYAWFRYGGTPVRALEYVASYDDLINALGADPTVGRLHFEYIGSIEQRAISFDGLQYVASYSDLINAFGVDEQAGSTHFIQQGVTEGRARDLFDAGQYLENYADLQDVFGTDEEAATRHYITTGFFEGRTDDASTSAADFLL